MVKASFAIHSVALDDPKKMLWLLRLYPRLERLVDRLNAVSNDGLLESHAQAFLDQLDQYDQELFLSTFRNY